MMPTESFKYLEDFCSKKKKASFVLWTAVARLRHQQIAKQALAYAISSKNMLNILLSMTVS
jgi:hypothetical protein